MQTVSHRMMASNVQQLNDYCQSTLSVSCHIERLIGASLCKAEQPVCTNSFLDRTLYSNHKGHMLCILNLDRSIHNTY